MTFTKQHAERLLTLAYFLKTQVPKKHFYMGNFTNQCDVEIVQTLRTTEPKCGTTACAVGWCPAVFPKDWRWSTSDNSDPRLIDRRDDDDPFSDSFTDSLGFQSV